MQLPQITAYSSEDTMGHHLVTEFITEDFRASVQEVIDKALQGDETANFQLLLMTKAGARVEVLLNATSRKDAEGHVIGVVGIGQDITARIAQEQEYIRLIDTANAPIFGVDAEGKVTVWNKCAAPSARTHGAQVPARTSLGLQPSLLARDAHAQTAVGDGRVEEETPLAQASSE